MQLKIALALVLVALAAFGASADRAITYKTLLLGDLTAMSVDRRGTSTVVTVAYSVKDLTGNVVKTSAVNVVLTAGQQTTLESFITSVMLPAANTQEGL